MGGDEQAVRCLVHGRVQGVWYRASTANRAEQLNLRGWVKNLADGRVEVVIAGPPDNVAAMCRWLWVGPSGAEVAGVTVVEWTAAVERGFHVS
ncbi:MAG TPA: acylphosphatase [Gammaproteobacteria bacterium]|nr:acylphosphatase [Gammaproteobacteria bacterium]